jgi:hypothetical protein
VWWAYHVSQYHYIKAVLRQRQRTALLTPPSASFAFGPARICRLHPWPVELAKMAHPQLYVVYMVKCRLVG